MTQQERFETAKAKLKAFETKHGNTYLFPSNQRARALAIQHLQLQDAVSDAFWTDEMDEAISIHVTNEEALTMIEHAIDYLRTRGYPDDGIMLAIGTLYEAHKAVGPMGQIPSWEAQS